MKIAIIYGSTTGNTQEAADLIKKEISGLGETTIQSAGKTAANELTAYDLILLGSSTWGWGEMQDDWQPLVNQLATVNLSGKAVAIFGTGDQQSYSSTFVDAIGLLYAEAEKTGAKIIGQTTAEGYDFVESKAVIDGNFVGLALDNDSQSNQTLPRIKAWIEQLKKELNQN